MKPPYDDYCYECGGYGEDYYIDDDGELKCRCPECPFNDMKGEPMTDTERERITAICEVAGVTEIDDLSDGFHTFRQLYYQRMILFAAIVRQNKDKAWKSLRHEDGELCFGGGWFVVGIDTPEGSYTYHYENKYFDLFDCEILDYGKHWDGHTEKDVTRLLSLPKAQHSQEGTTFDPPIATDTNVWGTISRQAALEKVRTMQTYKLFMGDDMILVDKAEVQTELMMLPSALNNQVNLCDSCTYTYPECPSKKDDVIFGNGIGNDNICACNKYQPIVQPVATDTNVGDKISKFIDGLEEIFADLRERHVDDSVCGLCEYDGAYMGQSGDWCNECPGFDRDDCFKLSDETRKKWTEEIINALLTVQPECAEGEWVQIQRCSRDAQPDLECPFCGHRIGWFDMGRYCAGCGAKLKGGAG